MNDIHVTITGNVTAEPRQHTFSDGSRVTSLRVITTSRYYDKKVQEWRDGDKTVFAVRCWRALGDNVAQSIRAGHPVVVQGRLRIREFGPEGERRFMAEVEAGSVGHDLRWGMGSFTKPQRGGAAPALDLERREMLDRETEDWAFATTARPALSAVPAWPARPEQAAVAAEAGMAETGTTGAGAVESGTTGAGAVEAGTAEAGMAGAGAVEAGLAEAGMAGAGMAETGIERSPMAEFGRGAAQEPAAAPELAEESTEVPVAA
jgi:single-strand DNA-binding protein